MKIKNFILTTILILISTEAFAEFNMYGSVRVATFYTDKSDNPNERDSSESIWELQNNSRIGGTIKKEEGSGGFEFGNGFDSVEIRKLYGVVNLSKTLKFKIGKDYTPLNYFPSNQVGPGYEYQGGIQGDIGLKPFGGIYAGFENMLQLSTERLKIALIEPATISEEKLKLGLAGQIERTAPKCEISYHLGSSDMFLDLYTGWQNYNLIEDISEIKHDINSYVFGINYGVNFGPMYVTGNAYSGQNINPYGLWAEGDDSPRIISNEIYDCTTDGYLLVFGCKIANQAIIETGAGYITHNVDGAVEDDETFSAYLNIQYQFNSYFNFSPEIGMVDYMSNNAGTDEGKNLYAGLKWQLDF